MKQSGDHVKIYSELGVGTTVKLHIPRLLDKGAASPTQPARPGRRHRAKVSWSWWWRTMTMCGGPRRYSD
jgi:hypothetical protein